MKAEIGYGLNKPAGLGFGPVWVPPSMRVRPIVYAHDFGTGQQFPKQHTFARTSAAWWYRDDLGTPTLTSYSSGAERVQSDIGQLLEGFASTQEWTNPTFTGATDGVIGSGGVLPTNMGTSTFDSVEITQTTWNGLAALQFDVAYDNSGGGSDRFPRVFEATGVRPPASSGDLWSSRWRGEVLSLSGTTFHQILLEEQNSSYTRLAGTTATITGTGEFNLVASRVFNQGTTAYASLNFGTTIAPGQTYSASFVLATPQIENIYYPSSIILTGSGTRNAETKTATISSNVKTLVISGLCIKSYPHNSNVAVLCQIDDGSNDDCMRIVYDPSDGKMKVQFYSGGVSQASLDMGAVSLNTEYAIAASWEDDNFAASLDGATAVTDTSGTAPTGITTIRWGSDSAGANGSGLIAGFAVGYSTVIPPASV